jgi:hypothetical protein
MMNKTGRVIFIFNDQGVKYPSPTSKGYIIPYSTPISNLMDYEKKFKIFFPSAVLKNSSSV